jgi:DNA-binding SARP family transcriptional activator/ABC-type transport system substrate-binding protein
MNLQLLGPVEATLAGRLVPLGATKQRAVLAMLALDANATVSVDRLVDGLWGEDPPATAAKMVQLYVSQLRRLLRADDGAEIVTHGRGYELCVAEDRVDVARFERLLAEAGRAGGVGGEAAREALGLWHGAALADVADEPFAAAEIRRLEELRWLAAELAVDADLAAGRHDQALPEIARLLEGNPLRERLHGQRMLALYRSGRQAEALAAYRDAHRRLVDDAGVEPGSTLRDLHERILRQDPMLILPAAEPPRRPPPPRPPPPLRGRPAAPGLSRRLWIAAAGVALASIAVFALARVLAPDRFDAIDANAVGLIEPARKAITAQYAGLGSEPGAVAAGDGSVWVASDPDGTVARIHRGGRPVDTFDAGPAPIALAFGAGSLWVADEQDGAVRRVDPVHDRVVQTIPIGNGLHAVAVGQGAVWAATALDGQVVRIDPRSERLRRIQVSGHPVALATGAGAVWVAAQDASDVVRIDPGSREPMDTIPVGSGPSAIAVGLGAVWTANQQDGTVSRIDPATDHMTTVPAGHAPVALAIADGALWVADAAGALLRLDPHTGTVMSTVRTGSSPAGLATLGGALWASAVAQPSMHRGGTLRVGLGSRPPDWSENLDPAVGGYIGDPPMFPALVYEGLLAFRRAPGVAGTRLVEGLARAVPTATDGGRRYVLRLRPGLRYADGTAVHASDFRSSVERALAIGRADGPQLLDAIVGAPACHTAPALCDLSRGIIADDRSGTITLRLSRPDPELLESLAVPVFALVSPHTPRRRLLTGAPIGTGPYRVERLVPGARAVLARNPYFRPRGSSGRPAGLADRIVLIRGTEAAFAADLERGRLDVVALPTVMTARQMEMLHSHFGTGLRSGPLATTEFAFLNVTRRPFDDPRVRLALNLAIDRARVVDLLGGADAASATCQVLPIGLSGYQPICPFTAAPVPSGAWRAPDLTRARRLVAAARGMSVTVWTYDYVYPVAAYLAEVLQELGFRSHVQIAGPSARGQAAQMGFAAWGADSPEAAGFMRAVVACGSTNNFSHFCDHGIDGAIARAQESGPAAWQRVERRIARAAPIVPLTNQREVAIASPRAGNLQFNPLEGLMLDRVWVR